QNELFTIYLVRHAEKDLSVNSGGNPPLTECGLERAEKLSLLLSDVPLDVVYSTGYIRTKSTALPTAKSKGLETQEYSAGNLEVFSKLLLEQKEDALVVGHSNTTAVLAGLLIGEELADIDLDTYNRVYQVVIDKKNSRLHLLHTAFECKD
ncbi:MAG: SixA phosphatase family protein, partial [Flavobacteriales bacterium]